MKKPNTNTLMIILIPFFALAFIFSKILLADLVWVSYSLGALFVLSLAFMVFDNRKNFNKRSASMGISSLITVILVICIIGVLNFLSNRYPYKIDLTKNKIHSLTDQSVKVAKRIASPMTASLFASGNQREAFRPLLENYKDTNPNFKLEFVDPNKEPTRVKALGIKKENTLYLSYNDKSKKIEEITEEKVTNALISLLEEKKKFICFTTGHGEESIDSKESAGYQALADGLKNQGYGGKSIQLIEGKIPEECNSLVVLGPKKAFFDAEIKAIDSYLKSGGTAVFAVDLNITGKEASPSLVKLLSEWHVEVSNQLVVDPLSRVFQMDASTPIIATYSTNHPITKGFEINTFFPLMRALSIKKGAPATLKVEWIARTTPKSWAETDVNGLTKGRAQYNEGVDKKGPIDAAYAIEGKLNADDKSDTRIVVFSNSGFANNQFSRFGGNIDLMLNAISWTLKDDHQISIRSKESDPGKIQLSRTAALLIFWISVVLMPLIIAAGGIFNWWRRKRL